MSHCIWAGWSGFVWSLVGAGVLAFAYQATPSVQDGPSKAAAWNSEWFADQAEQDTFMRTLKQAAVNNPELHGSVSVINDVLTGQPLGATGQRFGLSGELGMLANDGVRTQLDISDSQYQEMQTMQDKWLARLQNELKNSDRSDLPGLLRSINEAQRQVEQSWQAVLLPPQRRHLEQATWEQQLLRRGLATLLSEAPLKETLGVTDSQAKDLLELEAQLNEEIATEVARLQHSARQKLLDKLTPRQQSAAAKILGPALKALAEKRPLGKAEQTPASKKPPQ